MRSYLVARVVGGPKDNYQIRGRERLSAIMLIVRSELIMPLLRARECSDWFERRFHGSPMGKFHSSLV